MSQREFYMCILKLGEDQGRNTLYLWCFVAVFNVLPGVQSGFFPHQNCRTLIQLAVILYRTAFFILEYGFYLYLISRPGFGDLKIGRRKNIPRVENICCLRLHWQLWCSNHQNYLFFKLNVHGMLLKCRQDKPEGLFSWNVFMDLTSCLFRCRASLNADSNLSLCATLF